MTVLYGSSVADGTLTTACDMAATTGGTETSKTTTLTGANNIAEVLSKGGTSATVTSIPTTPTGNGWVYKPGSGIFAAANWSAVVTVSGGWGPGGTDTLTIRFFKYSGGSYSSIGSIVGPNMTNTATKNAWSFTATSMPATTFVASDLLYIDLWLTDVLGAFGDDPVVYESTSATAGVANDMQVTTSTFTPLHIRNCDGYGGVFS